MHEIPIQMQRLTTLATLPEYHSDLAAGMDLHAALSEPVTLEAGEIRIIPTGIAMAMPAGYEAQIRPRSGLAGKHGVSIPNAPGTVDADYRGEIRVALINLGSNAFTIEPRMRIAQMVIAEVTRGVIEEVESLTETVRGAGGFGSTGH